MQSQIVAVLVPIGCRQATLVVRRGNGEFTLQGIDARVASATRLAATWYSRGSAILDPATEAVICYEVTEGQAA